MPARHAHFSSHVASTSSPSSWGTPMGSMTTAPGCPPVRCAPLPHIASSANPLLSVTTSPLLYYNLTVDPSTAHVHPSLSRQALNEPATLPPMPFITIVSPYIPWSITVSPSKRALYVTVADVLDAVYHFLRQNIAAQDFQSLDARGQQRATDAYKRRYKCIPDPKAYETEKAKGVKRIDFLFEATMFMGLIGTKYGPEVWELHVAAPA